MSISRLNYHRAVTSDAPLYRFLRRTRAGICAFSLPGLGPFGKLLYWFYIGARALWNYARRVFLCEPMFKAACKSYGRNLHTDVYVPWIDGNGDIIIGENVTIDGYLGIAFAARYTEHPMLTIGDNTGIGHNCSFTIASAVTIGRFCRIASDVFIFDSSGHPTDPVTRMAGDPTPVDEVRPVTIHDNVWIGRRAIIHPGVTIGEGSIVSAGAVVMMDVPSYTIVAGNPARKIGSLNVS